MQQVITEKQAREITGGRKTLTIVPYDNACASLRECLEFDDVKYWSDLSDAYEAWAKINRDETVLRLGRAIKLRASERMGQIAIEKRPQNVILERKGRSGQLLTIGGPRDLLVKTGLTRNEASTALVLARNPERVREASNRPKPPTPHSLRSAIDAGGEWSQFIRSAMWSVACTRMKQHDPADMARAAARDSRDLEHVRSQVVFMQEWLDAFEQALPKEASGK